MAPTPVRARDARVIDASGLFIIPGLADVHVHVLNHPWDDKGNIRPRWDRDAVLQNLRLLLSFGVTTIRDPGSETEAAVKLRDLAPLGPTIYTAGRILNDSDFDPEPFIPVHDDDAARREVEWQAKAGVDAIKVYASTGPAMLRTIIDAAHAQHLPVLGHLQRTTWTEAARMGIDGLEHPAPWSPEYVKSEVREQYRQNQSLFGRVFWLEHLDDAAIDEMIQTIVEHHTVVDPTLIAIATKFYGDDPRWTKSSDIALAPTAYTSGWAAGSFTKSWTPAQYGEAHAAWPKLLQLIKRYYDGGVTMTVGTDTPTPWIVPGASVHDEMVLLVNAGIPKEKILQMATRNAALALKKTDIGGVAPRMRADLVLLERNPLDDIRNTRSIRYVIKDGVVYRPVVRTSGQRDIEEFR